MSIDPEVFDMIGQILVVNAVATLLLVVMSYAISALMLDGLAVVDKWLDPSRKLAPGGRGSTKAPNQPSPSMPPARQG